MTDEVGATPMVSNAPSRGHSWTISVNAADRNAPATRAAAALLEVASAAMSRPPGRRHGTSAASQRVASSSCRPPTFSTTSAGNTPRPSGSSARRDRHVERALLLVRATPGAHRDRARLRTRPARAPAPRSRRRRPATAARSPRRGARPSVQRSTAANVGALPSAPESKGPLTPIFLLRGRKPIMSEPTSMTFCVRLGPGAPPDKIGGKARSLLRLAEAGLPVPKAIVVTTDLLASLRAGGPHLPMTLAAPGALTTVEGAARALAAAPWPEGFAYALAREIDTLVPEPGARYAVRSSASIEDEAGVLAAGLFLSRDRRRARRGAGGGACGARVRALPGGGRLSRAARAGHRPPRLRGADSRVHRGRGGGRGGVRSRARRSRRRSRCRRERRRRSKTRRARAHRTGGAGAGVDQRRGRAGMGGQRRPARRSCSCGRCNRRRACGAPPRRWRCRRSIRCPRPRIAT